MSRLFKNGVKRYIFDGDVVKNPFSKDEAFIPQSGGGFLGGETQWQSADDIKQRIESLDKCIALAKEKPDASAVTAYEKKKDWLVDRLKAGRDAWTAAQLAMIVEADDALLARQQRDGRKGGKRKNNGDNFQNEDRDLEIMRLLAESGDLSGKRKEFCENLSETWAAHPKLCDERSTLSSWQIRHIIDKLKPLKK